MENTTKETMTYFDEYKELHPEHVTNINNEAINAYTESDSLLNNKKSGKNSISKQQFINNYNDGVVMSICEIAARLALFGYSSEYIEKTTKLNIDRINTKQKLYKLFKKTQKAILEEKGTDYIQKMQMQSDKFTQIEANL